MAFQFCDMGTKATSVIYGEDLNVIVEFNSVFLILESIFLYWNYLEQPKPVPPGEVSENREVLGALVVVGGVS